MFSDLNFTLTRNYWPTYEYLFPPQVWCLPELCWILPTENSSGQTLVRGATTSEWASSVTLPAVTSLPVSVSPYKPWEWVTPIHPRHPNTQAYTQCLLHTQESSALLRIACYFFVSFIFLQLYFLSHALKPQSLLASLCVCLLPPHPFDQAPYLYCFCARGQLFILHIWGVQCKEVFKSGSIQLLFHPLWIRRIFSPFIDGLTVETSQKRQSKKYK